MVLSEPVPSVIEQDWPTATPPPQCEPMLTIDPDGMTAMAYPSSLYAPSAASAQSQFPLVSIPAMTIPMYVLETVCEPKEALPD